MSRLGLAVFVACLAWSFAMGIARADDKATCIAAHEHGQEVRLANHWVEARRLFLSCAQPSCPPLLVHDCTVWESELAQRIPSIVVVAKRADGSDVDDVTLSVDGERLGSRLPATSISLDPGEHLLKFEHPGWGAIESRIILRDGEHDRTVEVRFNAEAPGTRTRSEGAPFGVYAAGAAAVGAAGVSVTLLVLGKVREHDLATSPCGQAGTCSDAQVAPIRLDYVGSGIAAGAAALAVGILAWQLLAHGSRSTAVSAFPLRIDF